MQRYVKGARSERELLNRLYGLGYSVIRSAGSGVNSLGPDVLAIKDKVCISFECKAWERGSLSLDEEQYAKLADWERNTAFPTYVAWRMNGKGWHFIKLSEFTKGKRNYNVTMKKAFEINRSMDDVLRIHSVSPDMQQAQEAALPDPALTA